MTGIWCCDIKLVFSLPKNNFIIRKYYKSSEIHLKVHSGSRRYYFDKMNLKVKYKRIAYVLITEFNS